MHLNDDMKFSLSPVLTTRPALSSKSLVLCFYMKTIRAKQAKVYFSYFVHGDQLGTIAERLG